MRKVIWSDDRALPGRFPTIVENKSLHAAGEPHDVKTLSREQEQELEQEL